MQQYQILNSKEIKKLKEQLQNQFDFFPQEDYAYLLTTDQRVFLINKDIARLELKNLLIDRLGLYFAEVVKNGEIRLSKEGAQLLAREARQKKIVLKNTVSLDAEALKEYFQGQDLSIDLGPENKLVILQYQEDVLGCAKYKEKTILNFLPKIHRGEVII